MDKKVLESVFGGSLIAQGFSKKALSWYRHIEGTLQVVDLQKSAYGLQFYVNLCCVPAGMNVEGMPTPKEHKCPIRIRFSAAVPQHRDEIDEVFDLERTRIADSSRSARLTRLINELLLPFLDNMKNAEALRQAIKQGVFKRGAVSLAAQEHLGITEAAK